MKKLNLAKIILILFPILFGFFWMQEIKATDEDIAKMHLNIEKTSFLDPDFLDLNITVEAPVKSYNAVMSVINYDANLLSIETTNIDDSFCKLIVPELPSAEAGRKIIICGNPEANATTTMTIASIKFKKLNSGWTKINLDDSRVLSHGEIDKDMLFTGETQYLLIE